MAQKVELSDALYQAIDDSRNEDQSIQDVIEEMAIETGVLGDISSLSELRPSLQSLYGFNDEEVEKLLSVLRILYIAEAEAPYDRINYPDYNYDSWTLYDLDLRQSMDSQRLTPVGRDVASEAVEQFIQSNSEDLHEILDKYSDEFIWFFLNYGLNRLGSGHLTTHDSLFNEDSSSPWQTERIREAHDDLIGSFQELEIAVSVSTTVSHGNTETFTVFPPELKLFISQNILVNEENITKKLEVYDAINEYLERGVNTRDEILDQLNVASESDLADVIHKLEECGLTSKYLEGQSKSPFMVQDINKTTEKIQKYTESELGFST